MAELADAYGSGPYGGNFMQVQVLFPAPTPAPTPANMDALTGKDVTTAYAVGPTVQDLRQERNCPLGYYQVFRFLDIDFNVRFAAEQISLSLLAVNKLNNSSVSFVG